MIDIKTLKPEDKDRKVVYQSYKGGPLEEGRITSWNDTFIFVDYTNVGRGNATPPNKLEWIYEKEI
jgi:hypothetical protein